MRAALTVAATTTLLIARSTLTKAMATTTTSAPNKMPTLKGVVFDMDDTLVRSNLDIRIMYRKVFGTDPSDDYDILKEISAIESSEEKTRAYQIINEMEEESRQQMTLMPGCTELLTWLSAHKIPRAIVTRNNRAGTDFFCQKFLQGTKPDLSFERIITRDEKVGDQPIPPKPDPTAMNILAEECFACNNSEILMVGDSVANDVAFGINAGTKTALLLTPASDTDAVSPAVSGDDESASDITVNHLTELPKHIWKAFEIDGPLGNTQQANQRPLHGSPPPTPESELCQAVVSGDLSAVRALLEDLSLDDIIKPDETNGNTALIWACEIGNADLASLLLAAVVEKSKNNNNDETENNREQQHLSSFANHRGFLGATALNRAARRGHTHVLDFLLSSPHDEEQENKNTSSTTIPGKLFDMDLPNYKLQHPLHFAAFKKNPEALEYLLKRGANPWVLDRKGRTPLEDTSCETCQSLLREAMSMRSSSQ
jgi:HAD superfamily hydrolase (TIGR01549 family)